VGESMSNEVRPMTPSESLRVIADNLEGFWTSILDLPASNAHGADMKHLLTEDATRLREIAAEIETACSAA
jgi:hypothetical protein